MIRTTKERFGRRGELLEHPTAAAAAGTTDTQQQQQQQGDGEISIASLLTIPSSTVVASSRNPKETSLLGDVAVLGGKLDTALAFLSQELQHASVLESAGRKKLPPELWPVVSQARSICAAHVKSLFDEVSALLSALSAHRRSLAWFAESNRSLAEELSTAHECVPFAATKRTLASAEELLLKRIDWVLAGTPSTQFPGLLSPWESVLAQVAQQQQQHEEEEEGPIVAATQTSAAVPEPFSQIP